VTAAVSRPASAAEAPAVPTLPQGYMTFPGIQQVMSGSFTLQHGISPGVASLQHLTQTRLPRLDGALQIYWNGGVLLFQNCQVNDLSVQRNDQGLIASVSVWDRRWKWQYACSKAIPPRVTTWRWR